MLSLPARRMVYKREERLGETRVDPTGEKIFWPKSEEGADGIEEVQSATLRMLWYLTEEWA